MITKMNIITAQIGHSGKHTIHRGPAPLLPHNDSKSNNSTNTNSSNNNNTNNNSTNTNSNNNNRNRIHAYFTYTISLLHILWFINIYMQTWGMNRKCAANDSCTCTRSNPYYNMFIYTYIYIYIHIYIYIYIYVLLMNDNIHSHVVMF